MKKAIYQYTFLFKYSDWRLKEKRNSHYEYNSLKWIIKRVYPCPVIVQLQHKIEWSCAICSWMKSWSNTQPETTTNEKHTQTRNDGRQKE